MVAYIYPYLMRFTRALCTISERQRRGGGRREREKGEEARGGKEGKESELSGIHSIPKRRPV